MNDGANAPRWHVRVGLRMRVAITFAALGLVVSTCVAFVAVHFSDSYVHRLVNEMLRVEGDYLRERFAEDGRTPHPHTKHFYVYSEATGTPPPPEVAALAPGIHEITDARGERHVAVYAVRSSRLYVVLDIGLESVRERRLFRDLIALVLFGTGLSAWLGWLWAGRAIAPVRRLAALVEILEPSRAGVARLASGFALDEVGALAEAFDRYQEKLHEYVRRERAFTADASHELRTPLAVIRGAVEVLLDGGCDHATEARLKRIQRGVDELGDLLDALLVLARSDAAEAANSRTPDLDAVVAKLMRERTDALREKGLQIAYVGTAGVEVAAPPRVLGVVIGNLLRAATQFADGGVLRVEVSNAAVRIALDAPGSVRGDDADRVLGLSMIRRVCERWGWILDEGVNGGPGHDFVLRLSAPQEGA